MSRGKELIKNTGILLIAKVSTYIVNLLLLPLYTSLLTTGEYGEVDLYTSLSMVLVPLLTLQVEMGLFRFYISSNNRDEQERVISSASFILVFSLLISTIFFFGIGNFIKIKYRILAYLYYISAAILNVLFQVCRAQGKNILYGTASFLSAILTTILNIIFIAGLGWKVEGILISSVIAFAVSSIFMAVATKINAYIKYFKITRDKVKQLLLYSVPLVFNQISSWAINYSDRLIILMFLGIENNGIYSLAVKFANIINSFFVIYNTAWTENVIRSIKDEDGQEYVQKMFKITLNIYLFIVITVINVLPFGFRVLVNEAYNESYNYIPILLIGMFFSGISAVVGSIYIAHNKTKEISITTFFAGICNVSIHLILLKKYKLYAAAVSTLLSFFLLFLYRLFGAKKFFKFKIILKEWLRQVLILIYSIISYYSDNKNMQIIGNIINLVFCSLFFYKLKKAEK